jgi:hypothetical protein
MGYALPEDPIVVEGAAAVDIAEADIAAVDIVVADSILVDQRQPVVVTVTLLDTEMVPVQHGLRYEPCCTLVG